MKTLSKILLGIAVVLVAAFGVKNIIDYEIYRKSISSAPFDIVVGLNALLFVLPASIIAAVVLFSERKTRALAICAAVCAAVSVEEFVRQTIVYGFDFFSNLLTASPYIAATSIFAVFVTILVGRNGDKKKISRILFGISGAITVGFVIMCIIMTVSYKWTNSFGEFLQMFFFYGSFFLLPAVITAAAALYLRGNAVLPAVGAAVCTVQIVIMLVLQVLWITILPALIAAAACVILAVLAHKKKEV